MKVRDQEFIRRAIELANHARQRGNHPFGAVLVGPQNEILLEAENTVVADKDIIAHAETNLIRSATQKYTPADLSSCTIYTSTEPCPMCAGAIFWSNIRRVVYGLSEENLYAIMGEETTDAVLKIACREIFDPGNRSIEVIGPMLEGEAAKVHIGFWSKDPF